MKRFFNDKRVRLALLILVVFYALTVVFNPGESSLPVESQAFESSASSASSVREALWEESSLAEVVDKEEAPEPSSASEAPVQTSTAEVSERTYIHITEPSSEAETASEDAGSASDNQAAAAPSQSAEAAGHADLGNSAGVTEDPVPSSETATTSVGRQIYYTRTGSKYHYRNPCGNGTYYPCTLDEAMAMGLGPCSRCVG